MDSSNHNSKFLASANRDRSVYSEDGNKVKITYRSDKKDGSKKRKSGEFEEASKKRSDKRGEFQSGFRRKMLDYKTVTDDVVVFRDRFGKIKKFATKTDMFPAVDFSIGESSSRTLSPSLSSTVCYGSIEEEDPDNDVLKIATPSKFPGKLTARKMKDDKHCRICSIESNSKEDREWASPWIGCTSRDNDKGECKYWLHSKCKGFPFASQKQLQHSDLDYMCPEHLFKEYPLPVNKNDKKGKKKRRR